MSIKVTVILPVLNEENHIEECLKSILNQDYSKKQMELLIIDGGSSDNTIDIINEYMNDYSYINLYKNPEKTVPTALNIGIFNSKGEFIIRMDAHTIYHPTYVSTCINLLENRNIDNVGGPMRAVSHSYVGKAIAATHHCIFGLGGGRFHNEKYEGYVKTVYLGAFRKNIFDKIGYFNPLLVRNQDIELNSRILQHGGKIFLTPKIISYYQSRVTIAELWKQNFNNGKWNIFTILTHRDSLSIRHFIPLLFIISIVLLAFLGFYSSIFLQIFILMMIIYISLSLLFSTILSIKKGIQLLPILPIVFYTLHFSYGFGSIAGLFKINYYRRKISTI